MKTKSFFMLFLVIFLSKGMISQNPVWTLPPYYYDNNNNLTLLPSFQSYYGNQAERTHNAMVDKDGNLRFFIIDNLVHTSEGAFDLLGTPINRSAGNMGTEVVIIPFPDDCNKYYIFYSYTEAFLTGPSSAIPLYAILDLPTTGGFNMTIDFMSSLPYNSAEIHYPTETSSAGFLSCGITTLNSNNERFILFRLKMKTVIYTVNYNGVHYVGVIDRPYFGENSERGEMEIIELPNSYRIAYSYRRLYNNNITIEAQAAIDYFDIDKNTGLPVPSTGNTILYPEDNNQSTNNKVYIHGLEFSPDGNTIYITHNKTTLASSSIDYFNIGISTNPTPLSSSTDADDFQNSQIEYKNGKLYFVNSDRIATYDISTNNWDFNAKLLPFTYDAILPSSTQYKTFQLVDQVDGMDYNTIYDISVSINANPSQTICLGQSVTLTASGASTYEWVDNNNPSVVLSTNAIFTPQPTTTTTYTVFGYNNGCDGQNSITITVNPLPTVSLDDVTLCEGDDFPVILCSGFGKGYSFNWTNNGVTIGTASCLTVYNEGTYCVTVTRNSTGCSSLPVCATVEYDPRLQYNSDFTLEVLNCNSTDPNFNVLATFPLLPTGLTFWWQVCEIDNLGNEISCMTNNSAWWNISTTQDFDPEYTFVKGHIYKITRGIWSVPDDCMPWQASTITDITCNATAKNGVYLSSRDESIMKPTTSSIKNTEFTIYPNPSSGIFTASIERFSAGDLIQVLDYSGKIILERKIDANSIELNIVEMANGLYFVKVVSANGVTMEKLIKN